MKNRIILLTKEILRCDYLPLYGNTHWKTPNLDALAARGTVFRSHYTNAPSTAMAITCMFSGLQAHELARRYYSEVEVFDQAPTVFSLLQGQGYATHVLWSAGDHRATYSYSKCYGEGTRFHRVTENPADFVTALDTIEEDRFFLWIHMPTVLGDRPALGSDIDLFDDFVGRVLEKFPDAELYVSADHGHMNLEKGIPVYGFHVYEGSIHVPFITPRIGGLSEIMFPTSHSQFPELLFYQKISQPQYVYADTQYYLQVHRKLAIIKGKYKYIYNKFEACHELYDLKWDPAENANLVPMIEEKKIAEPYRQRIYDMTNIYFYPYLEEAGRVLRELRGIKESLWRSGGFFHEGIRRVYRKIRLIIFKYKLSFDSKVYKDDLG